MFMQIDTRDSFHCPVTLPFWYEKEEPDHVQKIIDTYCLWLDKRINCTEFIGKIKRCICLDDPFTTYEELYIYYHTIKPAGSFMTQSSRIFVTSSWNEDGLPDPTEISTFEAKMITKGKFSYLYGLPIFMSDRFKFISSKEDQEVSYAYCFDLIMCITKSKFCKEILKERQICIDRRDIFEIVEAVVEDEPITPPPRIDCYSPEYLLELTSPKSPHLDGGFDFESRFSDEFDQVVLLSDDEGEDIESEEEETESEEEEDEEPQDDEELEESSDESD